MSVGCSNDVKSISISEMNALNSIAVTSFATITSTDSYNGIDNVMKQVAEEYTQRGLTSTNYRFELLTGLSSIINQLRSEYMHETIDDDGENNILLDQFGDRSKNSPTDSEQGTR